MPPTQLFDGSSTERETRGKRNERAGRRLADLAQAVRQHEDTTRGQLTSAARPQDGRLYRRLREICGLQSGQ
jgi:hypothetical protein